MTADITQLCPELQIIYKELLMQCKNAGLNTRAIVTYRSGADQDKAKAAGLSNAGAGDSPHNCCDEAGNPASKAFDYGIFEDDGSYVTDGTDPRYRKVAQLGKGLNLVWGGDWTKSKDGCNPDYDHLQMAAWKST